MIETTERTYLTGAGSGDHHRFDQLTAPYRPELKVHCYRMLGSLEDAEDLVQETLLRAWRSLDSFEGRASFRAWLYKIATNACLNAIDKRSRRPLPAAMLRLADPNAPPAPPDPEFLWLEPYPDQWLGPVQISPEARYTLSESVRLAFLVALQQLPPRQRAVLLLGFFTFLAWIHPVRAQTADLPVLSNEVLVDFPNTATFRLELDSDVTVAEAELTYQLGVNSCLEAGTIVPVEDIENSTAQWSWIMSRSGNPPPGATLWWEWTVTDTSGSTFTTPRQELMFQDERFQWQTLEAENIRLHWYESSSAAQTLLDAAVEGLARLESDIGIQLEDEIQIFIYGSSADMRDAVIYIQDWAGGVAFVGYDIILLGVPSSLAPTWGAATIRHELAHLVVGRFGQSCLGGSRPTWLEEGLAVYLEGEPDNETLTDLENAIENNSFYPVRSLNGAFPAHDSEARLAYSQSYSLVNFLLETYGPEKMQELILTLAQAEAYDAALEQIYGFNADGLEVAWRESIGAPPRQIPPTPTPISAAAIPTVVPLNGAQSVPTQLPPGAPTPVPTEPLLETPIATTGEVTAVAVLTTFVPLETIPASSAPPTPAPSAPEPAGESSGITICGLGAAPLLGIGLVYLGRSRRRPKRKDVPNG